MRSCGRLTLACELKAYEMKPNDPLVVRTAMPIGPHRSTCTVARFQSSSYCWLASTLAYKILARQKSSVRHHGFPW